MRQQCLATVVINLHLLFAEHFMKMIVAGSADPENACMDLIAIKQASITFLAVTGTWNQMMASQRG